MKKTIFVLVISLCSLIMKAQSFYDLSTIQEIKIYFPVSNWDNMMDTAKAGSEGYILSDSVVVNGTRFTGCGVKYKGNSSYNITRPKNPLHIKLDYSSSQDYQGFEDIKLGNGFSDPSFVREASSYLILKQYMDAPLSNFAQVSINGAPYGLMSNIEDIGNKFLNEHYFSSKNTFVKCNPDNAGPGSGTGSSLIYAGTDSLSTNYDTKYEMKSEFGWKDLINLCDSLSNYTSSINDLLDIDRVLWMHAFNNVLVNLDSYSGSFRQNYYLYRNHANQWIPTS